jgi:hypothetical protein
MATKETVAKEFIFEYDVAMHAENYGLQCNAFGSESPDNTRTF